MTLLAEMQSSIPTIGIIVAAMAVVGLIEIATPLHARGRWNSAHLGPNFALTFITFATNMFFNAVLVMTLMEIHTAGIGLLPVLALPPPLAAVIVVFVLDFSFYVAHVSMHKVPLFWRFHRVHHSDPAVDVTTTIRQHPGEGVIRYAFMAAFAIALGASPAAFAIYRAWSALHGLLEHANLWIPRWLDRLLVLFVSTPNMHKVHHSRAPEDVDTNYSNLFSIFDRLFSTFTPSARGVDVACGLEGFDQPGAQTTVALLAMPFGYDPTPADAAAAASLTRS